LSTPPREADAASSSASATSDEDEVARLVPVPEDLQVAAVAQAVEEDRGQLRGSTRRSSDV